MTRRLDVHAPSSTEFDPSLYTLRGCFDNNHMGQDFFSETIKDLENKGYSFGYGGPGRCGHCGTAIRYFALLSREDVKEIIAVGQQCLDNRFSIATAEEFHKLRESARLNRERADLEERLDNMRENPSLARLLDNDWTNDFLADVRRKALESGRLTDIQISAVERTIEREDRKARWAEERRNEAQKLAEAGVKAPEGKVEVTGVVTSAKKHESPYGESIKIVVKSDEGWKVWLTAPSGLLANVDTQEIDQVRGALLNKRIRFTATLTKSPNDETFAFAKRPMKATFVTDNSPETP